MENLAAIGLTNGEIAELLGRPRTTLQSRYRPALDRGGHGYMQRLGRETREALAEWRQGEG